MDGKMLYQSWQPTQDFARHHQALGHLCTLLREFVLGGAGGAAAAGLLLALLPEEARAAAADAGGAFAASLEEIAAWQHYFEAR